MPDAIASTTPPRDWTEAFAALPLEAPAAQGWARIAARLDARRRPAWPVWLATAAALALAVGLPWKFGHDRQPQLPSVTSTEPTALEALHAESAQLEALVAYARDERVASASALAVAGELDTRIGTIDAALRQPQLPAAQQLELWQQRVDALRALAGFESTQRWLAAQGERYDGALVRVD